MSATQVPLAEHFHSVQGEGFWVGTPMHFIRVPGCPVGAKATREFKSQLTYNDIQLPILSNGQSASMCQTYDGRFFTCDTDFHVHEVIEVEDLLNDTYEKHICLTGGEPLIYQSSPWWYELIKTFHARGGQVHIETSGTIQPQFTYGSWITVAPKKDVLPSVLQFADEIKFLVDESFDFDKLPEFDDDWCYVYLSPINGEKEVNQANVALCLELLKHRPKWRLSAQWHKFLGVR